MAKGIITIRRVDCPRKECQGKGSVDVKRQGDPLAGSVIGYYCINCKTLFHAAQPFWDRSADRIIYVGLEVNPEYAAKGTNWFENFLEQLLSEKMDVRAIIGKHIMFSEAAGGGE